MRMRYSSLSLLRRANDVLRRAFSATDLSMGSIQALLLIAETPAQSVSWVAQEMQMSVSGTQRVLLNLSAVDRLGRPGPALVEQIVDPLNSNRKLIFLTEKGRELVNNAVAVFTDQSNDAIPILTADDYIKQHEKTDDDRRGILLNTYTPQQVATAKRSLRRKGIEVGRYVIAFPLQPARPFIPEIRTWLDERRGKLWELEDVSKPDGMAVAELPNPDEQFAFVVTFRRPTT